MRLLANLLAFSMILTIGISNDQQNTKSSSDIIKSSLSNIKAVDKNINDVISKKSNSDIKIFSKSSNDVLKSNSPLYEGTITIPSDSFKPKGEDNVKKNTDNLMIANSSSGSIDNELLNIRSLANIDSARDGIRSLPNTNANSGQNRDCTECELDWSAYGSECCDSAWDEYGIDCATLESTYGWDCAGCACPGDAPAECGDGSCNGDETYDTCPEDCNAPGECDAGYIIDCVDDDCCPESWIGDGFGDCEDQAYGCDLTCYDNDGGDCDGSTTDATTGGTTGGTADCEDCELDWSAYGSECCDTAWVEYGIDCATLEGAYGWDCSGCECPGDNGGTSGGTTTGDGGCTDGYVDDCAGDGDCCPESWIGDGFADCEDQAYGCDLTCYDCDGGDCGDDCGDTSGGTTGGDTYGCTSDDACNYNPDATVDDGSCDFGIECWDGSVVCDESDCPEENPDVYIIVGDAVTNGEAVEVELMYKSVQNVAGIQLSITDNPDFAQAVDIVSAFDGFTASFNDYDGVVTALIFSLDGLELPATDESTVFATLVYELSVDLGSDECISLDAHGVVVSNNQGQSIPAAGVSGSLCGGGLQGDIDGDGALTVLDVVSIVNFVLGNSTPTDYEYSVSDLNGDGDVNVLDVVELVNLILYGELGKASDSQDTGAKLDGNTIELSGDIGAIQFKGSVVSGIRGDDILLSGPNGSILYNLSGSLDTDYIEFDATPRDIIVASSSGSSVEIAFADRFSLFGSYPNPFNPTTTISYDLYENSSVNISIYNIQGHLVKDVVSSQQVSGSYSISWDASQEPSGVYLMQIAVGDQVETQKLLLVK